MTILCLIPKYSDLLTSKTTLNKILGYFIINSGSWHIQLFLDKSWNTKFVCQTQKSGISDLAEKIVTKLKQHQDCVNNIFNPNA